jgi:hypothetical protein
LPPASSTPTVDSSGAGELSDGVRLDVSGGLVKKATILQNLQFFVMKCQFLFFAKTLLDGLIY